MSLNLSDYGKAVYQLVAPHCDYRTRVFYLFKAFVISGRFLFLTGCARIFDKFFFVAHCYTSKNILTKSGINQRLYSEKNKKMIYYSIL
jgi:hypothetical protein